MDGWIWARLAPSCQGLKHAEAVRGVNTPGAGRLSIGDLLRRLRKADPNVRSWDRTRRAKDVAETAAISQIRTLAVRQITPQSGI